MEIQQAAAVALGVDHDEIARRWGLGASTEVASSGGDIASTAAEVRAAYAATRERQYPTA